MKMSPSIKIDMMPNESVEPYIEKTVKLTKKGGFNIQRIGTSDKKWTVDEFIKAMENYRKKGFPVSAWRFTVMMVCSINSFYYSQHTHLGVYENELFKYLTETEIDETRPFLSDRIIFFPEREKLAGLLAEYFEIDRIVESKGIGYWGTMHTYVMRRK